MLLAVDIGNANTVIGLFDGERLASRWRVATEPDATPDMLAMQFANLLDFAAISLDRDITGCALSSVVPSVTETMRLLADRYLGFEPVVVGPGVRTGLNLRVDNPRQVGADRIANAMAAEDIYGGPAIVVDFDVATSFDVVDGSGTFIGGAIAPGVTVSTDALTNSAALLPRVTTAKPKSVIGRTTEEALQSGIVYGFAGQVDALLERIIDELGGDVTTIATGRLVPAIIDATTRIDHLDAALTLKGLRLLWERNT